MHAGVRKNLRCFFPPKHPVWDNKRGRGNWEARRVHERLVQGKARATAMLCKRRAHCQSPTLCLIWGEFVWVYIACFQVSPHFFSTHYEIPSRCAVTVHTLVICSIQTSPVLQLLTPIFPCSKSIEWFRLSRQPVAFPVPAELASILIRSFSSH